MNKLILAAVLAILSAESQADSAKATGIFTSMQFGSEDVRGVEVFITYSDGGYFAQVQCAEGAISRPVVVPVSIAGPFVEFSVPKDLTPHSYSCPSGKFKGEISANGIKGHFEGTNWPGTLKRTNSYWN